MQAGWHAACIGEAIVAAMVAAMVVTLGAVAGVKPIQMTIMRRLT
jgi:hypothetical protein